MSDIIFVIRNGLRWRDAPAAYGPHKTIYNRFICAEYVSVSLPAPEFETIYGNIANAPGDDPMKKVIIWNSPN